MESALPTVVAGLTGMALSGHRCVRCGHPVAAPHPRCPVCAGELRETTFARQGTVWSSTRLHVSVQGRDTPYALAYVDLDDGPRVLAHSQDALLTVGARVTIAGTTARGDLLVDEERTT
jgi:uncharacterized OB-fold protein